MSGFDIIIRQQIVAHTQFGCICSIKKFLDVSFPLCKRGIEGDFRVELEKQNKSGDFK